jgi:hypothetical protein
MIAGPSTFQRLPTAFFNILHHDLARLAFLDCFAPLAFSSRNRSEDCTSEPHPQINPDADANNRVHNSLVVGKIEVG